MDKRSTVLAFAALLAACLAAQADIEVPVMSAIQVIREGVPGQAERRINVQAPASDTAAETAPERPQLDALRFLNGDTIHGTMVSVRADEGATWDHPDVDGTTRFRLDNLKEIRLRKPDTDARGEQVVSSVGLTNGDVLHGTIAELNDDSLVLDTAYAGRLSILKVMIATIAPGRNTGDSIYEGPDGIEGWVLGRNTNGVWSFRNGAFYSTGSNGSIGRDVGLPDMARIEFDMAWTMHPYMYIYLYTDRTNEPGGNAYMLSLSAQYVNMQRYTTNIGSQDLGNINVPQLGQKKGAHFSIMVDKEKKLFGLAIDGALVKQWTDSAGFAGKGTGLLFYSHQGMARVSGIRVSKWDGRFDTGGGAAAEGDDDVVEFINGDRVSGKATSIREDKLTFETAYATLDVPVERVRTIEFSPASRQRARRNKGDVEASFHQGGRVTVKLAVLEQGKLTGSSENFGEAVFDIRAFSRFRLNIYDERHEGDAQDGALSGNSSADGGFLINFDGFQ